MRALLLLCTGCNALLGVHGFDAGGTTDDMRLGDSPDAKPACDLNAPFSAPVAVAELNTAYYDSVTDISDDELTLYMASDRDRPGMGSELFYTTRASKTDPWRVPLTRFYAAKPAWDDYSVAISPDGMAGIVSSNRSGMEHLWLIMWSSSGFVDNSTMVPNVNSAGLSTDATPRYSRDGATLYFDSSRSGSRDLYYAAILPGSFGAPQRISELSSPSEIEAAPTLTADGRTIYYLVKDNIYTATRPDKTGLFGAGAPASALNTSAFEGPGVVTSDGCTIYITRDAAQQLMNVFVAKRPPL